MYYYFNTKATGRLEFGSYEEAEEAAQAAARENATTVTVLDARNVPALVVVPPLEVPTTAQEAPDVGVEQITTDDFSARAGMSQRLVQLYIRQGYIKANRIGRDYMIPATELESPAFLERRKRKRGRKPKARNTKGR